MNHAEYNGWWNYETWAVNLWLTNEQDTDSYWRERAKNAMRIASRDRAEKQAVWTLSEHARFTLADDLKDQLENDSQDMLERAKAGSTMWADLIGAALSEVNWNEIANAFLEGQTWDSSTYESMKS